MTPPVADPAPEHLVDDQDEDEARRRREEAMEQLMLAQEHQDLHPEPGDGAAPAGRDEDDDALLLLPHPATTTIRKRIHYTQTSFAAAAAVLYYALRTRQQWYLALVYLTASKWAYIVLGNAVIALCVSTFQLFTKTFLHGLRLAEAEGLGDFFRWNVTETCLALTMFRGELEVQSFLVFLLLILAKCLHWVADMREGHLRMTQEAIVPIERGILKGWPTLQKSHLRLCLLLQCLMLLDVAAVIHCGQHLAKHGPSVTILFAFETAILLVTAMSNMLLWNLHVVDGLLHYLHDHTSSTRWIHSWLHAWKDRKATLTFAVEVQAQGAKFLFYVTFFAIVLTYYGLPINLFREVYLSFHNLKSRLVAFANYRRLMASMNRFESVQTEEELDEVGRVCIICRDDMTLQACKKLPGCGHVFHTTCLREWLVQQQSCPTCRGDITAMEARQRLRQRQVAAAVAAELQPLQDPEPEANITPVQDTTEATIPEEPRQLEHHPRIVPETDVPVFPSFYRIVAAKGAPVWDDQGEYCRTVSCGMAILCTKLQWNSFNGRSGMMLRMPDGWVREGDVERILGVRLSRAPDPAQPVIAAT